MFAGSDRYKLDEEGKIVPKVQVVYESKVDTRAEELREKAKPTTTFEAIFAVIHPWLMAYLDQPGPLFRASRYMRRQGLLDARVSWICYRLTGK